MKLPGWISQHIAANPDKMFAKFMRARDPAKGAAYACAPLLRYEHLIALEKVLDAHHKLADRIAALEQAPASFEYRGVWKSGETYKRGNSATMAGSLWIAKVDNTGVRPGEGSVWQLAVKRGAEPDPQAIAKHLLPDVLKAIEGR